MPHQRRSLELGEVASCTFRSGRSILERVSIGGPKAAKSSLACSAAASSTARKHRAAATALLSFAQRSSVGWVKRGHSAGKRCLLEWSRIAGIQIAESSRLRKCRRHLRTGCRGSAVPEPSSAFVHGGAEALKLGLGASRRDPWRGKARPGRSNLRADDLPIPHRYDKRCWRHCSPHRGSTLRHPTVLLASGVDRGCLRQPLWAPL